MLKRCAEVFSGFWWRELGIENLSMKARKKKYIWVFILLFTAASVKALWFSVQIYVLDDRGGYLYEAHTDEHFYHEEAVLISRYIKERGAGPVGVVRYFQDNIRWTVHWGYPVSAGYVYSFLRAENVNILRVINVLLSLVSVILAYLLSLRIGVGYKFGYQMMLILAAWPLSNLFASTSLKESSVIFLMLSLIIVVNSIFQFFEAGRVSIVRRLKVLFLAVFLIGSLFFFRVVLALAVLISLSICILSIKKIRVQKLIFMLSVIAAMFLVAPGFYGLEIIFGSVIGGLTNISFEAFYQFMRFYVTPLPGQAVDDFRAVENFTFLVKVLVCAVVFGLFLSEFRRASGSIKYTLLFVYILVLTIPAGYALFFNDAGVSLRTQLQVFVLMWILFTYIVHARMFRAFVANTVRGG